MPADSSNKRQRLDPIDPSAGAPVTGDDAFIQDHDAVDASGDEDDDDEKPKSDKKAGRRKIKIEFIQDKSRRHITFSKRKAGIMKKARISISTLTLSCTSLLYLCRNICTDFLCIVPPHPSSLHDNTIVRVPVPVTMISCATISMSSTRPWSTTYRHTSYRPSLAHRCSCSSSPRPDSYILSPLPSFSLSSRSPRARISSKHA